MTTKADQATPTRAPTNRIPALDGLRGIAVLLVLIHHFSGIPAIGLGAPTGIYKEWLRFASVGWAGVDLFFVLSGFLITSILYDSKGAALGFFKNFYARRMLRIFPVYYVLVIFVLFVLPWVISGEETASAQLRDGQLWLWLYLRNIQAYIDLQSVIGTGHLVGHIWSLCVEEQFYLVWPMVVFLFGRRSLIAITAVLVVTAAIVRLAMFENGDSAVQIFVFSPARMDGLAVGAGIALLVRSQQGRAFLSTVAWPVAATAFMGLVALFIYERGLPPFNPTVMVVGFSLLAAFFGGVIAAVVLAPPASALSRIFSWQPLTALGKYSYAIYVIHFPVVQLLVRHTDIGPDASSWAGFQLAGMAAVALVASVITLILTLLSWKLLETPILSLKSRFSSGHVQMSWGD